ncbi:MAG: GTPase, partial [Planctomycetota bacterium]
STPGATARLAEPGEFTFRAYTAGKLDLTQAEGVGATISAVSDSQLAAGALLRRGQLGKTAERLVNQLGNLLALVEAGIDFTDQEDVTPVAPNVLSEKVGGLTAELDALLTRSRSWGAIEALPRVVLVGPPSAGKSTLFNALLGRQRAVIDPMPGTTRDVLAEPLQLDDDQGRAFEVMLVDLAGLDEGTYDQPLSPDREAQHLARQTIKQADLLLRLSDEMDSWVDLDAHASVIDVLSKCDTCSRDETSAGFLRVSGHTREGLDSLRRTIADGLTDKGVSVQADLLALQPRHEAALRDALSSLHATLKLLSPSVGTDHLPEIELLAQSMRSALDALASLGGQLTPDEVIGRVFATFCVGK